MKIMVSQLSFESYVLVCILAMTLLAGGIMFCKQVDTAFKRIRRFFNVFMERMRRNHIAHTILRNRRARRKMLQKIAVTKPRVRIDGRALNSERVTPAFHIPMSMRDQK